jgi:hypothetical protein
MQGCKSISLTPKRLAVLAWTLMSPLQYFACEFVLGTSSSLNEHPCAPHPFFGFGIFSYALGLGALFCLLLGLLLPSPL